MVSQTQQHHELVVGPKLFPDTIVVELTELSVPSQPLSLPNFTSPTITQANFFCPFIKPFLLPADHFSYFYISSLFSLSFVNLSLRKMSAGVFAYPAVAGSGYHGLKALPTKQLFPTKNSVARSSKTVSNGSKTFCMKVI